MKYEPIHFEGINSEIFMNMKDTLSQFGISVPEGNEGFLSGEGFSGVFKWNSEKETLTLELISKPWFISYDTVKSVLCNVINNYVNNYPIR